MTKKEYKKLENRLWKIIESKIPPAEFIIKEDDPRDFKEYLTVRYIEMLAGLE